MARIGGNPETFFTSNYSGKLSKKPYGAKMPVEIEEFLQNLECASDFVRDAVIEKYQKEKIAKQN
jgi:hypothetical protein